MCNVGPFRLLMSEPPLTPERFPRELEILRNLADELPQIVWVARPDGSHEHYNQRWYEFTGRPRDGRPEPWSDLFHPDDTERADRAWAKALASGEPYEIAFRLKRAADGVYRWFLGRALPFRDESGKIVNWFGTCTDIHSLKSAQDALRTARDELQEESRQKDEFLGVISHELQTPLNAVFGWTRLMQENVLNEQERTEAVNSIIRNAEAQGRLIEEVLDITRIVNQRLSLDRKILNLNSIVNEAAAAIASSAEGKAIKLKTLTESRDLRVYADPARLQQVVLHLLTNAVQFTAPGGRILLRVARQGDSALVEVSDTGKGINADLLPHIFERFRQRDRAATDLHGGLGLGLTIAHQLVLLHDGEITAQSDGEGKGSKFRVMLPVLKRGAQLPQEVKGRAAKGSAFPSGSLRGLHVMVVDDDAGVRDIVALTLAKCGASVTVANSGEDALNLLPNLAPDVVVSDIAMPGLDGYEFIRRFRALMSREGATVHAIALTAFSNAQERERALEAGFNQQLAKPIDPTELVRAIAESRTGKLAR